MAKDLVCGMQVDEKTAKHVAEYRLTKYYFCSAGCNSKFELNPEKYIKVKGSMTDSQREQRSHSEMPLHHEPNQQGSSAAVMYYCPMHPHITSKQPGRCPDCGMKLEEMVRGSNATAHSGDALRDFKRRFWISTVLTVPILSLSPMIQEWIGLDESLRFGGDSYVLFVLSSIVFFYGGYPFLQGLSGELRAHKPGMMTLIAIAIMIAYVYSSAVTFGLNGSVFFWELATLIDIMLIGHWIEMRSVQGASRAIEALARLMPAVAHKELSGNEILDVPLSEINVGDRVLVKPGEKIPADGKVVRGESSVNESMLTGESNPVVKTAGSPVIGGSINGEGSISVVIERTGADSFLSQIIDLVNQAHLAKSKTQDLANRAALWLTIIAIVSGTLTLIVWILFMHKDFSFGLERSVTVMVITCPHALGLAIPLVVAISTALAAGKGLLIRNRTAFETARNIQAIIFDKTGTLTEGKFGVTDTLPLDNRLSEQDLLKYAASVEAHSEHPIAKAIRVSVDTVFPVEHFNSIPGKGAEGTVNGRKVRVMSPGYLSEQKIRLDNPPIERLLDQGKTVVFVLLDEDLVGAIALADIVRRESKEAIAKLKSIGIRCMMLTGDNHKVADWVSKELELDEYFAEVLPQDKAARVREVQSRGLIVAMVGDGVNDAPALAQADVGIAIGAGTDVAIETADVILVKSNPLDVVSVIELSRATYKKMVQNLIWATGYNAIAIPLAAGVLFSFGILLSPALGAVLMSVSTVVVAINAKTLRV